MSLAGSRQSLSGSRSQLTQSLTSEKSEIPKPSKTSMGPPESIPPPSKRASFIETGFLETLKPQFTPGQSLTSPSPAPSSATEDKIHNLQLQHENDELKKSTT